MNIFHLLSLIAEVLVTGVGIKLGLSKKQFGWFLAATFAIYVFYDLTRFISLEVPSLMLDLLFLIASLSILIGSYSLLSVRMKK